MSDRTILAASALLSLTFYAALIWIVWAVM